jgi:trk system potassium uptake protein TrkH
MYKTAVGYAIGKLMQVLALTLVVPLGIALHHNWTGDIAGTVNIPEVAGFLIAILTSAVLGSLFVLLGRKARHMQGIREGYAIVTLGWLTLALMASIPLFIYFLSQRGGDFVSVIGSFTDAYFEVMSGFTTTGASILSNVEALPKSLLFLRALTHWLGGMGIITLAMVIFPAMGVSGYQMFRGEVPGPSKDRLRPRLAQTASVLWGVYLLLTGMETVLLLAGGMSVFDAVCHAFATLATGGFSTKNASIAAYASAYVEWVIIVFMYLAGVNFVLHLRALRGDVRAYARNNEFFFYTVIIAGAILVATVGLYSGGLAPESETVGRFRAHPPNAEEFHTRYVEQSTKIEGFSDCIRIASFEILTRATCTGFVIHDTDLWPEYLRFVLLFLMFFGGCAGSTSGGFKMIRVVIILKLAYNEIRKLTQPRLIVPVKVDGQTIEGSRVVNAVVFIVLYLALYLITAALLTLFIPDLTTALSAPAATIANVGPGLSGVGALENYGWIPIPGKWILIFSMLLGRLEIFTVLIVLRPSVWRK